MTKPSGLRMMPWLVGLMCGDGHLGLPFEANVTYQDDDDSDREDNPRSKEGVDNAGRRGDPEGWPCRLPDRNGVWARV
ncbi:conserved hypothetical protein [Nitrospira defluvii]|uniref:Secreted protein n=1 Tax=Nitrospira defluvii TaxID=330214 RepID=A0ABM8SBY5_9BACT|nr:conserved hypothetical protein [Nitrospira defluvii]